MTKSEVIKILMRTTKKGHENLLTNH